MVVILSTEGRMLFIACEGRIPKRQFQAESGMKGLRTALRAPVAADNQLPASQEVENRRRHATVTVSRGIII
jgi:hypothetical protein